MPDRRVSLRTLDCGHTDENYVWPSKNLEEVCYDCFSAEADDAWWAMMLCLTTAAPDLPAHNNQEPT